MSFDRDRAAAAALASSLPAMPPEAATKPPVLSFAELGLAAPLLEAVTALGYKTPTLVQSRAVPMALAGGDWMVSAQTGSGKTAAFLLPLLQALLTPATAEAGRLPSPRVLVLCPTRELAMQVADDAVALVRGMGTGGRGLRVGAVVGGMPYGRQIEALRNVALVVATPGRLLDLIERRALVLGRVDALVLDEADRMLDLGFADDVNAIHKLCQQRRQTLMFSATLAPRIQSLAGAVMRTPQRLDLGGAAQRHVDIEQTMHWADDAQHKARLLDHWLRDASLEQAVVFASTQAETDRLAESLMQQGHAAVALHGAMPQAMRNRRLQHLRDGQIRVLVATDVAARGLDVPTLSHVFNFGLPMKAEDYVHRIGRTGRAGRSGVAVSLVEPRERGRLRAIEQLTRQPITASVIAGLEPKAPLRDGPGKPRDPRGARRGFEQRRGAGRPARRP